MSDTIDDLQSGLDDDIDRGSTERLESVVAFEQSAAKVEIITHGGVPKWTKGADCKSVIRGFESHRRLLSEVSIN